MAARVATRLWAGRPGAGRMGIAAPACRAAPAAANAGRTGGRPVVVTAPGGVRPARRRQSARTVAAMVGKPVGVASVGRPVRQGRREGHPARREGHPGRRQDPWGRPGWSDRARRSVRWPAGAAYGGGCADRGRSPPSCSRTGPCRLPRSGWTRSPERNPCRRCRARRRIWSLSENAMLAGSFLLPGVRGLYYVFVSFPHRVHLGPVQDREGREIGPVQDREGQEIQPEHEHDHCREAAVGLVAAAELLTYAE
jgi:hypothetical protein